MLKKELSESKEVILLKKKIEEWKRSRITTNTKMPEELWAEAAKHAKIFGVSLVSKFLKIGYVALKKQLLEVASSSKKQSQPHKGFVELPPISAFHTPSVMEVILSNSEGLSATIRCPDRSTDWENIFSGWLKASRSGQEERIR